MRKYLVLTLTGQDRVGIVEHVTKQLVDYQGNVESSKMAHLGGEFAMLMLVSVPEDKYKKLQHVIQGLQNEGYNITTRPTERDSSQKYDGWMPFEIKVSGADHEGIIYRLTRHLSVSGINIENMDTNMVQAPMSGTPLFTMTAIIIVPPKLSYHDWKDRLQEIGDEVNVTVEVSSYTG